MIAPRVSKSAKASGSSSLSTEGQPVRRNQEMETGRVQNLRYGYVYTIQVLLVTARLFTDAIHFAGIVGALGCQLCVHGIGIS